jgi:integrase
LTLGTYPEMSLAEARRRAKKHLAEVTLGKDPAHLKSAARKAEDFGELGALYIERYAKLHKRPTSVAEDQRILDAYLYPAWRHRKVGEIARRDVIALLDKIVHERKAPVMANRVRALASKVFNFAVSRDLVPFNPVAGVPRPAKEKSKDTVLSEEQIRVLWAELENRAEPTASVFRLILLTGQRPGEVKKMRWADVGEDTWRIPSEIAKNGREHLVPISPQARDVLDRLKPVSGEQQWVFATPEGTHVEWLHSMNKRINKNIKEVEEKAANNEGREPRNLHFTAHDLRRTAASGMGALAVPRDIIARVLNHKSADHTVTAVYDRYDRLPEMRRALSKWGAHLDRILTGKKAKVVNLA